MHAWEYDVFSKALQLPNIEIGSGYTHYTGRAHANKIFGTGIVYLICKIYLEDTVSANKNYATGTILANRNCTTFCSLPKI